MKTKNVERVYDRSKTCFAKWQEDTPASLKRVVTEDLKFWKAPRLVKNEEDVSVSFYLTLNIAQQL